MQATGTVRLEVRVTMKPQQEATFRCVSKLFLQIAQRCASIKHAVCLLSSVPILGCEGSNNSCLH